MPGPHLKNKMAYLILVRHGRSEWNDKGLWTGFTDIPLNNDGREEAKRTSAFLKDIKIDLAYTSLLKRAQETLQIILDNLKIKVPVIKDFALNERDYGDYTGKNKWQVKEQLGEDEFLKLRRSWDYPVPNGESLKMVYQRVIPYYQKEILPNLKKGNNILIAAHGNSIRALGKYLENISDEGVADFEIRTGEAWIYKIDKDAKVISKEVRAKNEKVV